MNPLIRLVSWYFRSFPIQRGKGPVKRLTEHFLQGKRFLGEFDHGTRIFLSLENGTEREIFFTGTHEPAASRLFAALIQPDDVILDLGANIGFYTLLAAKRLGPAGVVAAFEPAPSTYEELRTNVELNRFEARLWLNASAVSDRNSESPLHVMAHRRGGGHTLGSPSFDSVEVTVPTLRLDDYLSKHQIERVDLIKADIEGWEYPALIGCGELLSREDRPWILFEASEQLAEQAGCSLPALFSYLTEHRYDLFRILRDMSLEPVPPGERYTRREMVIAIPCDVIQEHQAQGRDITMHTLAQGRASTRRV